MGWSSKQVTSCFNQKLHSGVTFLISPRLKLLPQIIDFLLNEDREYISHDAFPWVYVMIYVGLFNGEDTIHGIHGANSIFTYISIKKN